MTKEFEEKRYSFSPITQGEHKFYSLTIPSDILGKCCFVTTREKDPEEGFQRLLDKPRAIEIAKYIDSGLGTIPTAIVLSAQPEAELELVSSKKTLKFKMHPNAFLILDGQHRVYGFSIAKASLRVPVIIYNGLSRKDETRLFIDINTKQRGVSNELLLDIKKLAEYENNSEQQLRVIFDLFREDPSSALFGSLSASSKIKGKITRVTFNSAIKPILKVFRERDPSDSFDTLNSYFCAFKICLTKLGIADSITNPIVFKAISAFFPEVASKVKDRNGSDYTVDNFHSVLDPLFERIKITKVKNPGNSFKILLDHFIESLKVEFTI